MSPEVTLRNCTCPSIMPNTSERPDAPKATPVTTELQPSMVLQRLPDVFRFPNSTVQLVNSQICSVLFGRLVSDLWKCTTVKQIAGLSSRSCLFLHSRSSWGRHHRLLPRTTSRSASKISRQNCGYVGMFVYGLRSLYCENNKSSNLKHCECQEWRDEAGDASNDRDASNVIKTMPAEELRITNRHNLS